MPHKTIHIAVKNDGTVTTDFRHFTGTDCLAAGKQIHALLAQFGVQVDEATITPKPELLAAQSVQQDILVDSEVNQETRTEG